MHDILTQRIIHYHELNDLKIVDDENSQNAFSIFIKEYVNFRNAKNVIIHNSIAFVDSTVLIEKK